MKVKEALDKENAWYRIVDVPDHSSYDAFEEFIGEDVEAVVKTVMLKVKDGFMAFMVRKDQLVDYKKLREIFGTKKLRMANAEEVLEHAKSPPGSCCPLLVDTPLYIDPSLLNLGIIHLGSGSLKHGLEMKTEDLIRILKPEVLDVSMEK
ncbi:aminoacyl-tRNA deacylase [Nanoarchaeota archaeon]